MLLEDGGAWCDKVEQFWAKKSNSTEENYKLDKFEEEDKLDKLDKLEEEELPSEEQCDEMNRFFHHFWNFDDWDTVPEKRLQWFDPDKMTLADQRRWRLEVTRRKKNCKGFQTFHK